MRTTQVLVTAAAGLLSFAFAQEPQLPLDYRAVPQGAYTPVVPSNFTTLGSFIASRPELSNLSAMIQEAGGFTQAVNTPTTWQFTFFAPSNTAFQNTGQYYKTYSATPKGKWWLGNLVSHHYIPNSRITASAFNTTATRLQTSIYLYVKTQVTDGTLTLNDAAHATETDIPVSNGVIHIIDHILDPSAQIFNLDLPKAPQSFIAGSCSNPSLPYC